MSPKKPSRFTPSSVDVLKTDFSLPHLNDLSEERVLKRDDILQELGLPENRDLEKEQATNDLLLDIADLLAVSALPEGVTDSTLVAHILAHKDVYFPRIEAFENPQFLPNYINENDLKMLAGTSGVPYTWVFTVVQSFLALRYLKASQSFCENMLDSSISDPSIRQEYQDLSRNHVWGDQLHVSLSSAPEFREIIEAQSVAVEKMCPTAPTGFVADRLSMVAKVLSPSSQDLKSLDPTALFWTDYGKNVSPKRQEKEIEWLNYFLSRPYLYVFDLAINKLSKKDFSNLLQWWTRKYADLILAPDSSVRTLFLMICREGGGIPNDLKNILSHRLGILNRKQSKVEEPLVSSAPKKETIQISTRAKVSLVVPPKPKTEMPSFNPQPEDIANNNIVYEGEIPEGYVLKVKISQATRKGLYKVPSDRNNEFSSVTLVKNEDGSFSFPDNLDWKQEGKSFGFEFFFEQAGQRSDLMPMVKVDIPKTEAALPEEPRASFVPRPPRSVSNNGSREPESEKTIEYPDIYHEPTEAEKREEALNDVLEKFNPSWIEFLSAGEGVVFLPSDAIDEWKELSEIDLPYCLEFSFSEGSEIMFEDSCLSAAQVELLSAPIVKALQERKNKEAASKVQKEVDAIRDSFPLIKGIDVSKFKESNYIYNGTGHFIWNQKEIRRAVLDFLVDLREKFSQQDYVLFYDFNGRLNSLTLRKRGKTDTNRIDIAFVAKDNAVNDQASRLDISVKVEGGENLSAEVRQELYQLGQCLTKYIGTEVSKILAEKKFDGLTKQKINVEVLRKKAGEFEADRNKQGSRVRLIIGEFEDLDSDPDLRKIEIAGKDLELEYARLKSEGKRVGVLYANHSYAFLNSRENGFTTLREDTIQDHYDHMLENRVHRNIFMERALATFFNGREFHKDRGPFDRESLAYKALMDWKDEFELENERELQPSDLKDEERLRAVIRFFSQYEFPSDQNRIKALEASLESCGPDDREALEDYEQELSRLKEETQVGVPLRYNPYVIVSLETHQRLVREASKE